MYSKQDCDACFDHAIQRIKKMAGVEVGEDWEPFTIAVWLADLKHGYIYDFGDGGRLKNYKIVDDNPPNAATLITMSSDIFVGEHTLEINLQEKYYSGEVTVKGDVEKLQRFALFADYEPYYPPGHSKVGK